MSHNSKIKDTETHFKINPATRAITNESASNNTIVQYDHESERFTFDMPRYVDGHDMSEVTEVRIHYCNLGSGKSTFTAPPKTNGVYIPDDVAISGDDVNMITFSWLLSSATTQHNGFLHFSIQFVCLDGDTVEYAWNTSVYKDIVVAESINNAEEVLADTHDVLTAYKNEITADVVDNIYSSGVIENAATEAANKVDALTKDAADRAELAGGKAEKAAEKAEEAADRAELAGGGISTEVDNRLKALEQWMSDETYEEMTAKLYVTPSGSKEYGDSVTGAVLTWDIDKEVSYVKLTLPNGTTVDKIIEADLTETPLSKLTSYTDKNTYIITASKTWTLNATRADGNKETKLPTATISRQYRVYWGLGTQEDGFDSDFVKSLQKQGTTLTTSKGRNLTFSSGADNQYVYYAIPTALGTPTFQIGDFPLPGGFEDGVKISVDTGFTDANSNPIRLDYNLYRSSNLLKNNETFNVYVT